MLLNAAKFKITTFTVSELLRKNQLGGEGGGVNYPPISPSPRLGLKFHYAPLHTFLIGFTTTWIFKNISWEEAGSESWMHILSRSGPDRAAVDTVGRPKQ